MTIESRSRLVNFTFAISIRLANHRNDTARIDTTDMVFAVHISDGFLTTPWILGGYLVSAILLFFATRRIRDEEIPRIALLTAAIFVASSIHIPVPPSKVHLLLNGLAGVFLGVRVSLAIFVGLALQWALIQHGGIQSLGINTCVQALPALVCGYLFRDLHTWKSLQQGWPRRLLVAICILGWLAALVYTVSLLREFLPNLWHAAPSQETNSDAAADAERFHDLLHGLGQAANVFAIPWLWVVLAILALAGVECERRCENAPEFPLGLLLGEVGVLATVALNTGVLLLAGEGAWKVPILIQAVSHLPIALIEGIIVGFLVGFLAKVKPEMLSGNGNGK